jgi:hypothetical protein
MFEMIKQFRTTKHSKEALQTRRDNGVYTMDGTVT